MMNRKFRNLIAVTTVLMFTALQASASKNKKNDEPSETEKPFVISESVSNLNLNPHTSAYVSEAQILNGTYEGLFSYNPVSLEPDNAIASEYRISRDKLRWTFTIRENAKYSNGKEITAGEIKESWLNLLANKEAYYSSFFDIIKGAQAYRTGNGKREDVAINADGNKLRIILEKPTSHLPKLLCHHAFAAVPQDSSFSGAYVIKSVDPFKIVLAKNEYYWDKENVKIPEIQIRFSTDAMDVSHQFNTGATDWISGNFEAKAILNKKALIFGAEFGTSYYFFKNRKESVWSNPDFRNAVLTAIPWTQLRAGHLFPAETLVCPLYGYNSPEGINYTDVQEAAMMMKQAKKDAGIPENEKPVLSFAIPESDYMENQAELLREPLEQIGVELKLVRINERAYLTSISKTDADLFTYTWVGDFADPLAFLELFRSNATMNDSKWVNKEYDALLEQASYTVSKEEHNKLLSKAEDILLSSGMIIPIGHPVSANVIDLNEIGGWTENVMDIHPFKFLYFKESKNSIPNLVMANR